MNRQTRDGSLYQLRVAKEQSISDDEIKARFQWHLPVLSQNSKCGISLDLPVSYCKPTRACAEVCYSCQGTQNFRRSVLKSLAIAQMINADPERVARKIIDESQGRVVRIAGSGEILPEHKTLLELIEKFGGSWWGFTKRIDTHRVLPDLMFSIDATTCQSVMAYVRKHVPIHRRAYLMRPGDNPPSLEVAVTFPVHGSVTPYVKNTQVLETDCPAVRKKVGGCWDCRRCY